MKLDRNISSDGRGKYALLNLRTNQIQWGDTPDDDFFVIKLKDRFAEAALLAYAEDVEAYAGSPAILMNGRMYNELMEYAAEIRDLAEKAKHHPNRKMPD